MYGRGQAGITFKGRYIKVLQKWTVVKNSYCYLEVFDSISAVGLHDISLVGYLFHRKLKNSAHDRQLQDDVGEHYEHELTHLGAPSTCTSCDVKF